VVDYLRLAFAIAEAMALLSPSFWSFREFFIFSLSDVLLSLEYADTYIRNGTKLIE
jgi:hypothetical protein